ncbi:unnamed protein product [Mytilus coruscus]|uniref:HAT C-terminal dimerisation domain-containing protein n=1 Tax=Mytilus coruscus TaxID=42192 RepID=A0A6J8BNS5_MYTCO|nr:unnamed protein product [Mytilus coruscus]
MRAEGYDGAAYMSGKHQGVQAHVRGRFPEASRTNDDAVWDALFDQAVTMADKIEVLPPMPRKVGRQVNRANYPADTPSQYWKRALYFSFLDYFIEELTGRLLDNSDRFQGQNLIPARLESSTAEYKDKLYETFRHDLTDNQGTFNSEVKRWQRRWSGPDVIEKPKSLMSSLAVTNKELYPSIFAILSMHVTMPITTSTTERLFSALRRLKTYTVQP